MKKRKITSRLTKKSKTKIVRNPKKPLDFYLKGRIELTNYKTFTKLTYLEKLELKNALTQGVYILHKKLFVLKYDGKEIPYYVGYIVPRYYLKNKYILGIVELYKDENKIEVHDYVNNIREINVTPNKQIVDSIFDKLLEFFTQSIFEERNGKAA